MTKDQQSEQDKAASDADLARIEVQGNTNAISRTMAVMVLMMVPGIAGHFVDKWLGTSIFVLMGFILGICIAIGGMLYVAKIADETAKKNRERKKQIDAMKSDRS